MPQVRLCMPTYAATESLSRLALHVDTCSIRVTRQVRLCMPTYAASVLLPRSALHVYTCSIKVTRQIRLCMTTNTTSKSIQRSALHANTCSIQGCQQALSCMCCCSAAWSSLFFRGLGSLPGLYRLVGKTCLMSPEFGDRMYTTRLSMASCATAHCCSCAIPQNMTMLLRFQYHNG